MRSSSTTSPGGLQKYNSFRAVGSLSMQDGNVAEFFSGELRKIGGKFKSWKRKHFVLEHMKLSYYSGPEKLRLLGTFPLHDTTVSIDQADNENPVDEKWFPFTIKPVGGQATPTETHSRLNLAAPTPEKRTQWIRAIRKQLYLRKGGALFGTPLSQVFVHATAEMHFVPRVVYDTTRFIRTHGLKSEGIFRKCGTRHVLQQLADAYDTAQPDPILNPDVHDVHAAAGLLKLYLRELPDPVVPHCQYDSLKATGFLIDDGQDLKPLVEKLEQLPVPNYTLLHFLCQFLYEVSEHNDANRMTIDNLASVFAPNILRTADDDPDIEMSASALLNLTVAGLIRCHSQLFLNELQPLNPLPLLQPIEVTSLSACPAYTSPRPEKTNGDERHLVRSFTVGHDRGRKKMSSPLHLHCLHKPPWSSLQEDKVTPLHNSTTSCGRLEYLGRQSLSPGISETMHDSLHRTSSSIRQQPVNQPKPPTRSASLSRGPAFNGCAEKPSPEINRRGISVVAGGSLRLTNPSRIEFAYTLPSIPAHRRAAGLQSTPAGRTNISPPIPGLPGPYLKSPKTEGAGTGSVTIEELRHWRSVALVAQAEAAGQRAQVQSLTAELARARCDLRLAGMEVSLLRRRLSELEHATNGDTDSASKQEKPSVEHQQVPVEASVAIAAIADSPHSSLSTSITSSSAPPSPLRAWQQPVAIVENKEEVLMRHSTRHYGLVGLPSSTDCL